MQPRLLPPDHRPARQCIPECWGQNPDLLRDACRPAGRRTPTCYPMQPGMLGPEDRPAMRCNQGYWLQNTDLLCDAARPDGSSTWTCQTMQSRRLPPEDRPATVCTSGIQTMQPRRAPPEDRSAPSRSRAAQRTACRMRAHRGSRPSPDTALNPMTPPPTRFLTISRAGLRWAAPILSIFVAT
jgi:hypothetical protein